MVTGEIVSIGVTVGSIEFSDVSHQEKRYNWKDFFSEQRKKSRTSWTQFSII